MSQAFKFGFGDEDIEVDDVGEGDALESNSASVAEEMPTLGITPDIHDLDDIIYGLPSSIQYNVIQLKSPNDGPITLPRRELFDIRAQLMAEDNNLDEIQAGLAADDIKPKVYEGGFKTWECSVDLANYLLSHASNVSEYLKNECTVVELGAGTALPTLLIFYILLSAPPTPQPARRTLVLADYNPMVLHLATIPNLLLTFSLFAKLIPPAPGDLDITPALLASFKQCLTERNIHILPIAGNWGTQLASLIVPASGPPSGVALMLASETIYSPESTFAFTICLLETTRRFEEHGGRARALVAAKKVYFGVGGGVDEFLSVLREKGGDGKVAWETEGMGIGVGRCVLEVTRRAG